MSNCGECLMRNVEMVALDALGVCPRCGTNYGVEHGSMPPPFGGGDTSWVEARLTMPDLDQLEALRIAASAPDRTWGDLKAYREAMSRHHDWFLAVARRVAELMEKGR